MPNKRIAQQISFVSVIEDESLEDMIQSVYVPERRDGEEYNYEREFKWEPWMDLWPDWEIAIAFQIGGGPHEWVCATTTFFSSMSSDFRFSR